MAEVYLLVAIHFVIIAGICSAFGYVFHRNCVENKQAEKLIEACEYRVNHLNAERLKGIING